MGFDESYALGMTAWLQLVKQALAQSISAMVATSLSEPERRLEAPEPAVPDGNAPIVVPDNERIATTGDERRLFKICADILPGEELQPRDTETYFTVTYAGRSNRWIFRFWGDRRRPTIQFIEPITDAHRAEAARAGLDIGSGGQIILALAQKTASIAKGCENGRELLHTIPASS